MRATPAGKFDRSMEVDLAMGRELKCPVWVKASVQQLVEAPENALRLALIEKLELRRSHNAFFLSAGPNRVS